MLEHKCPKCNSEKVWVGAIVLRCDDCGWHYLNKYPCSTCGNPSTGFFGVRGNVIYSCKDHHSFDIDKQVEEFKKCLREKQNGN